MTKPSERDLARAREICMAAWNQCRQDNTSYDDEIIPLLRQALANERASLPESVREALNICYGYICEISSGDSQALGLISQALLDIDRWQQGEIDTGKGET